jgi:hypothetical protein
VSGFVGLCEKAGGGFSKSPDEDADLLIVGAVLLNCLQVVLAQYLAVL